MPLTVLFFSFVCHYHWLQRVKVENLLSTSSSFQGSPSGLCTWSHTFLLIHQNILLFTAYGYPFLHLYANDTTLDASGTFPDNVIKTVLHPRLPPIFPPMLILPWTRVRTVWKYLGIWLNSKLSYSNYISNLQSGSSTSVSPSHLLQNSPSPN